MTQGKHHRHFPGLVTTVAVVGFIAAACGGYTPQLARIVVTPDASVSVNGTQQFTAVGRDSLGDLFAITPTWAVVADGGTINGTGLFTAGAVAGRYPYTVRATSGGVSGLATVVVTAPPVRPAPGLASITITPVEPDSLPVATSRQYTAVGRDSAGAEMAVTPTWSVVAGGGTITSAGVFTAGEVTGSFPNTIRAGSGRIEGLRSVTVASSATSLATMRELVHFAYDKSDLTTESRTALDAKVAVFGSNPAMRIVIVGHTDTRGAAAYNLALGTRRAEAVKAYLVAAGVDAGRIEIDTRGEAEPMVSGASDHARSLNRRDAFMILLASDVVPPAKN